MSDVRVVVDSRPIRVTVSGAQGTAGTGGGGGSEQATFIYDTDATQTGNVYNVWADFTAAVLEAPFGHVQMIFHQNITVPSGAWDWNGGYIVAAHPALRMTFASGASVINWCRYPITAFGFHLHKGAGTAAVFEMSDPDGDELYFQGCELTACGGPLIETTDGALHPVSLANSSILAASTKGITDGDAAVINVSGDPDMTVVAPLWGNVTIADDMIEGGGAGTTLIIYSTSPAFQSRAVTFAGWNGTLYVANLGGAVFSVDGQTGDVDLSSSYEAAGAIATALASHTGASDPHTGYLRESDNLASLASASTSRSNLGLGDAATKNVGTSAGTVAEGNDSRFTDTRTPTDDSVTSAKIVNGAIVNADVNASAAIDMSKLSTTGRRVLIYDTTLGADAATVQFTGLSGYRWMVLEVNAKTTRSGSLQASLQAQFNSDTGANYTNGTSTGQSLLLIGSSLLPGTGYTAYGAAVCDIFNVAAGEKHVIGLGRALSSVAAASFGGSWNNTSNAISTIDLSSSNSANIASGSRFLLWGVV